MYKFPINLFTEVRIEKTESINYYGSATSVTGTTRPFATAYRFFFSETGSCFLSFLKKLNIFNATFDKFES